MFYDCNDCFTLLWVHNCHGTFNYRAYEVFLFIISRWLAQKLGSSDHHTLLSKPLIFSFFSLLFVTLFLVVTIIQCKCCR